MVNQYPDFQTQFEATNDNPTFVVPDFNEQYRQQYGEGTLDALQNLVNTPIINPKDDKIPGNEAVQSLNSADFDLTSQDALPSASIQANEMINGAGRITQRYGNPNAGLYGYKNGQAIRHRGTDIAVPKGTPLAVPKQGNWVVDKAVTGGYNTGYGNFVIMRNLDTNETLQYSHLDKVMARQGQQVTGQVVGLAGSTGRSTGNHVDIEYTQNGRLGDVLTSPYRQYLGLNSGKTQQGAKGGALNVTSLPYEAGKWLTNAAINQGKNFVNQWKQNVNWNDQATVKDNLKTAWNTLNKQENIDQFNKEMYDPMVVGGIVGSVTPVDRATHLLNSAYIAKNSANLEERLAAIERIKQEAANQLTPQEMEKVKDFAEDNVIKKVHQRLLQEGTPEPLKVIPANDVNTGVDNMPNLLKDKVDDVADSAQSTLSDIPKELSGKVSEGAFPFGVKQHTTGTVDLADVKTLQNNLDVAKKTFAENPSFKVSNKPLVIGVDVNTGEKQLLDGYHRYIKSGGTGTVKAQFLPMRNGELIGFDDIKNVAQAPKPQSTLHDIKGFGELNKTTQIDTAEAINDFMYGNNSPWGSEELRQLLDKNQVTVSEMNPQQLKSMFGTTRGTSQVAVDKYAQMLKSGSEAPPVLIANGRFVDGGHRVEAAIQAGRKSIKVVDITDVLKDAETLAGEEGITLAKKASDIGDVLSSSSHVAQAPNPQSTLHDIKYYSGSETPTPSGKYLYLTPDKNYAGEFGKNINEYGFQPKNAVDLTDLGEKPITFKALQKRLAENGVKIDPSMVEENYRTGVSEPAWFWFRRYQNLPEEIQKAGKDSVLMQESIGNARNKVNSVIVLDRSIAPQASHVAQAPVSDMARRLSRIKK